MMKIVLSEFAQESNSFNPDITKRDSFEYNGIFLGKDIVAEIKNKPKSITGMMDVLEEMNVTAIFACSMRSQSGGPVDHDVLAWFVEKTIATIKQHAPVDGVFLSLHGATQTTVSDDACGLIIEKIRNEIGDGATISVAVDLHANVTRKMIKHSDFICGYQTYPHIDFYETGQRAAKLGMAHLTGKAKRYLARVGIPMIVPASGYSTIEGPFADLMKHGQSLIESKQLVDFSIFMMQPWLDVPEGASTVITIAEDKQAAKKHAVEIAEQLLTLKDACQPELYSIDQVIELAEKEDTPKPVILVDSADSSNAGATGDSMAVVKRILETGSDIHAASVLTDGPAALQAHTLGVGKKAVFSLGGAKGSADCQAIEVEAIVQTLHDGTFTQEGPAGRGMAINLGLTAVLRIHNVDLVVCQKISGNGDPQLYRAFGIEPKSYPLVVVKACSSFKAAYQLFAGLICPTDTPGAASVDLLSLNYKKLPTPFFPFSALDDYQITDISYGR
jgi:microcystin degradation protein MlrC